jgi:hypothetical protein
MATIVPIEEKYPQPNPQGFGSPIVLVYDKSGKLLLDLVPAGDSFYELALVNFSYDFNEKEEDECIITFSCASVALMDNIMLYKGQTPLVSWGYMDGNLRIPINLVVVDTKEKYSDTGYEFTVVMSDNLSYFSKAKNPMISRLEASQDAIKDLLHGSEGNLDDMITLLRGWKAYDYGHPNNVIEFNRGTVTGTSGVNNLPGKTVLTTKEQLTSYMSQLQEYYKVNRLNLGVSAVEEGPGLAKCPILEGLTGTKDIYDYAPEDINQAVIDGVATSTGGSGTTTPSTEAASSGVPVYPAGQFVSPDSPEAKAIAKLPFTITGLRLPVVGKNAQAMAQNACDKVSPYPMQVTGRDGKVVTYNKDRAIREAPIRTYIFKGGNGNFLEFTYDTNAKYSDDTNVLRQFRVDAETGAITQMDFLNSKKKVVDVEHPQQDYQAQWDRATNEGLENLALNNPAALAQVASTAHFEGYSGEAPDGGTVLVSYDQEYSFRTKDYLISRGDYQEWMPAVDNATRNNHPIVSVPGPNLEEFADTTIENELSNLRRGEQEMPKAVAKVLGDPQLVSGRKVVFQGLAKRRCGSYFITSCTHTIDQSGYITKIEAYWVGDISVGVNTVKTELTTEDLVKKANEIKEKKLKLNPNASAIKERGYYLRSDFVKGELEQKFERVDKDWDKKMPGAFYLLVYKDSDTGKVSEYRIKIPMQPNGKLDDPFRAFGYDAIYDLVGCHNELKVQMNTDMVPIVTADPYNNTQEFGPDPTYPNYRQ